MVSRACPRSHRERSGGGNGERWERIRGRRAWPVGLFGLGMTRGGSGRRLRRVPNLKIRISCYETNTCILISFGY